MMYNRIQPLPQRQAGVGLVTAIFLLVVLAGLAVAMVSVYTAQQASSNLDLQGARAYQAARAGLEWGLHRQMRSASCAARTQVGMPAGTTLSGFTVIVRCVGDSQSGLARFAITSVACNLTDSQGGCNCDGAVGACVPSNDPESVNRKVEAHL
jgi:MSHA biogenesis protein MshP